MSSIPLPASGNLGLPAASAPAAPHDPYTGLDDYQEWIQPSRFVDIAGVLDSFTGKLAEQGNADFAPTKRKLYNPFYKPPVPLEIGVRNADGKYENTRLDFAFDDILKGPDSPTRLALVQAMNENQRTEIGPRSLPLGRDDWIAQEREKAKRTKWEKTKAFAGGVKDGSIEMGKTMIGAIADTPAYVADPDKTGETLAASLMDAQVDLGNMARDIGTHMAGLDINDDADAGVMYANYLRQVHEQSNREIGQWGLSKRFDHLHEAGTMFGSADNLISLGAGGAIRKVARKGAMKAGQAIGGAGQFGLYVGEKAKGLKDSARNGLARMESALTGMSIDDILNKSGIEKTGFMQKIGRRMEEGFQASQLLGEVMSQPATQKRFLLRLANTAGMDNKLGRYAYMAYRLGGTRALDAAFNVAVDGSQAMLVGSALAWAAGGGAEEMGAGAGAGTLATIPSVVSGLAQTRGGAGAGLSTQTYNRDGSLGERAQNVVDDYINTQLPDQSLRAARSQTAQSGERLYLQDQMQWSPDQLDAAPDRSRDIAGFLQFREQQYVNRQTQIFKSLPPTAQLLMASMNASGGNFNIHLFSDKKDFTDFAASAFSEEGLTEAPAGAFDRQSNTLFLDASNPDAERTLIEAVGHELTHATFGKELQSNPALVYDLLSPYIVENGGHEYVLPTGQVVRLNDEANAFRERYDSLQDGVAIGSDALVLAHEISAAVGSEMLYNNPDLGASMGGSLPITFSRILGKTLSALQVHGRSRDTDSRLSGELRKNPHIQKLLQNHLRTQEQSGIRKDQLTGVDYEVPVGANHTDSSQTYTSIFGGVPITADDRRNLLGYNTENTPARGDLSPAAVAQRLKDLSKVFEEGDVITSQGEELTVTGRAADGKLAVRDKDGNDKTITKTAETRAKKKRSQLDREAGVGRGEEGTKIPQAMREAFEETGVGSGILNAIDMMETTMEQGGGIQFGYSGRADLKGNRAFQVRELTPMHFSISNAGNISVQGWDLPSIEANIDQLVDWGYIDGDQKHNLYNQVTSKLEEIRERVSNVDPNEVPDITEVYKIDNEVIAAVMGADPERINDDRLRTLIENALDKKQTHAGRWRSVKGRGKTSTWRAYRLDSMNGVSPTEGGFGFNYSNVRLNLDPATGLYTPAETPLFMFYGKGAKSYDEGTAQKSEADPLGPKRFWSSDVLAQINNKFIELQQLDPDWQLDREAAIRATSHFQSKDTTLSRLLDHWELFEEYPEFADMPVRIMPESEMPNEWGSWNPETNTIKLREGLTELKAIEVILHELQHAIQFKEGWAAGGNTAIMGQFAASLPSMLNNARYVINAMSEGADFYELLGNPAMPWYDEHLGVKPTSDSNATGNKIPKRKFGGKEHFLAWFDQMSAVNQGLEAYLDKEGHTQDNREYYMYRRLGGEIEANATGHIYANERLHNMQYQGRYVDGIGERGRTPYPSRDEYALTIGELENQGEVDAFANVANATRIDYDIDSPKGKPSDAVTDALIEDSSYRKHFESQGQKAPIIFNDPFTYMFSDPTTRMLIGIIGDHANAERKKKKGRTLDEIEMAIPPEERIVGPWTAGQPILHTSGKKFKDLPNLDKPATGAVNLKDVEISTAFEEAVAATEGAADVVAQVGMRPENASFWNAAMRGSNRARYWYEVSAESTPELFPDYTPSEIGIAFDVVSATSPLAHPNDNAALALSVLSEQARGVPTETPVLIEGSVHEAVTGKNLGGEARKTGSFAKTFKHLQGIETSPPLPTNDRQVAVYMNISDDEFGKNPVLYEVASRFHNNLRDIVNKQVGHKQKKDGTWEANPKAHTPDLFESHQLQALGWVEVRGRNNIAKGIPLDKAYSVDSYDSAFEVVAQRLENAGMRVPRDANGVPQFTNAFLKDPRIVDVLHATVEPRRRSLTGTMEVNTERTAIGKDVNDLLAKSHENGIDINTRDFEEVMVRNLKRLINRREGNPSVVSDLATLIMGKKYDVSKAGIGMGTWEGNVNHNARIPLADFIPPDLLKENIAAAQKAKGGLLSDDEVSAVKRQTHFEAAEMLLSAMGGPMRQEAQAASTFLSAATGEAPAEGAIRTYSVFVPDQKASKVNIQSFVDQLKDSVGDHEVNIVEHANGYSVEINPAWDENYNPLSPDRQGVIDAAALSFNSTGIKIIDKDWRSVYIERSDYDKNVQKLQDLLARRSARLIETQVQKGGYEPRGTKKATRALARGGEGALGDYLRTSDKEYPKYLRDRAEKAGAKYRAGNESLAAYRRRVTQIARQLDADFMALAPKMRKRLEKAGVKNLPAKPKVDDKELYMPPSAGSDPAPYEPAQGQRARSPFNPAGLYIDQGLEQPDEEYLKLLQN